MLSAMREQRIVARERDAMIEEAIDILVEYGLEMYRKLKERKKRPWTRKWIGRRNEFGGGLLLRELRAEDPSSFKNIMRMDAERFDELLHMIQDSIQRQDTEMRLALPARLKLEVTLRYLATGDSFKSLSYFFRLPTSSISAAIPEVLRAINTALSSYLKCPSTQEEWKVVAHQFTVRWNFPSCVGAIDGKHIALKQPPCSGTKFHNYKGFFSTILLALVDGDYNFMYVNIGTNGARNDAGIFKDSNLYKALEEKTLNLPQSHVILGDSAFPLKEYMMKPYSRRCVSSKEHVFNYRLSRARRIVENAFGILTWRFCVFQRAIELKLSTVDELVLAACTLHNWLQATNPNYITSSAVDVEDSHTGKIIPGQWRCKVQELPSAILSSGNNNYQRSAEEVRRKYTRYFWSEAPIPSQWKAVGIDPAEVVMSGNSDNEDEASPYDTMYEVGDILDECMDEDENDSI